MREPAFLRQNKDKWLEYERMLFDSDQGKMDPDRLAELYIQLTDDLAYSRTFYPKSQTVRYLNGLAARTHLAIYKNKKEKRGRFLTFWTLELPLIYREAHRYMLYSMLIFTFTFLIGTFAAYTDEEFLRIVLSDEYVDMTLQNIHNGDPMGVYKDSPSFPMFVKIAYNNIQVSFLAFVLGIFCSFGTIYILFKNGLMLGSFFMLFHTEGIIWEALPVIYIHGTLELSAIVIAGGAGFMLGNSILFPGTHTRAYSIQKAATAGVKIIVGLIPVFLLAAFLESYITRLTEMPLANKLIIIILSLAFVVWYYIIYPITITREAGYAVQKNN
ncbi:MAG: stage II sporulation protein M [Bacteroidia bacterium]|nr:stage II sporulation protein M [Bacteroidia bacterium]